MGSFDPDKLHRFQEVFESVWDTLPNSIPENGHAEAREALGARIIAAAQVGETSVKGLKAAALAGFKKNGVV